MGLFSGQFANVVEWQEYRDDMLFWKRSNKEIKKGSRLIIRPGQDAIFLYNGKVVGNWHKKASKNQIKIETTFFEDHPKISEKLINHALEKYKAFFLMP